MVQFMKGTIQRFKSMDSYDTMELVKKSLFWWAAVVFHVNIISMIWVVNIFLNPLYIIGIVPVVVLLVIAITERDHLGVDAIVACGFIGYGLLPVLRMAMV